MTDEQRTAGEGKPKRVNLRPHIAENAQLQELRMREKKPIVDSGDWTHHRRLTASQLCEGLERNVQELKEMAQADPLPDSDRIARQIADISNWATFVGLRLRGKD